MANEEKKLTTRRITMLKTVNPVQFLGINGSQLAVGMDLKLVKVPEGVAVSRGGTEATYVVYAANIAHVKWEEVSE